MGNGTLTPSSVSAATVGAYTFTLADLGVATESARLQIENVVLRAVATGTAGNSVRITVTPALTLAETAYAVMADWPAGEATMGGAEYDFGGLPLSASGEIDSATKRLQFSGDLLNAEQPLILVPHHLHPDEAALVRVETDRVEIADVFEFQPNADTARRISVSIPLQPVLA